MSHVAVDPNDKVAVMIEETGYDDHFHDHHHGDEHGHDHDHDDEHDDEHEDAPTHDREDEANVHEAGL